MMVSGWCIIRLANCQMAQNETNSYKMVHEKILPGVMQWFARQMVIDGVTSCNNNVAKMVIVYIKT